jgi:hypothetical protein
MVHSSVVDEVSLPAAKISWNHLSIEVVVTVELGFE